MALSAASKLSGDPGEMEPGNPGRKPLRTPATEFLHLFGLTALAVAQPVLNRLSHNDAYLDRERTDDITLWITLIVVLAGLPVFQFVVVRVISACSVRFGHWTYVGIVYLLVALFLQIWLKGLSRTLVIVKIGVPQCVFFVAAITVAYFLTRLYLRRTAVAQFVTVMSWGALAVPVAFAASQQIRPILFPGETMTAPVVLECANPVPIVMIVFDGLNGMALLNEQNELDAKRYPGFARLAALSTWYRNASTVHPRTDNAVPAILTGCFPPGTLLPNEASYPDNLFRRIVDSRQYDMTVFEPYTRLCPRHIRPDTERPPLSHRLSSLLVTLGRVYVSTTFPDDIFPLDGLIPRPWFGLSDDSLPITERTGLIEYAWDSQRLEQIQHFQNCLTRTDRPWFRYLHVVLPHYPWRYLPSGREYIGLLTAEDFPVGAFGGLGEDWGPDELACHQSWQQYLLQLGFLDHALNKFLDQLESQDMLDESLMIVVADHGSAFKTGMTRRTPTSQTLPDIMPVPLFIKLPFQTTGRVSDRNVETIDVFPTIADFLKMTPEPFVDGDSLLDESHPPRLRKQITGPNGPFIVEPDFPQRFEYVRRATQLFGSGDEDTVFFRNLNAIPELVGRNVKELTVSTQPGVAVDLTFGIHINVPTTESFVPCLLSGTVQIEGKTPPTYLAIAVNGRISATTRTYSDARIRRRWAAMSPESYFELGQNDIRIYEVVRAKDGFTLRRCQILP